MAGLTGGHRRRARLTLVGLAIALAGSVSAAAQTPPDTSPRAPSDATEPRRVRVTGVRFTGVKSVNERQLRAALATRESSRWPWGRRHYFSRTDFQDDLRRIRAFYADHGYPRARVDSYDIDLNGEKDGVAIRFHVDEGEPVRLDSVDTFGFDVLPDRARRVLQEQITLQSGQVRTRPALDQARDLALNALREAGYPYARVSILESPGKAPMTVAVILAAESGQTASFGPLAIRGNHRIGEDVIRRQLAFGPGDSFKFSRVLESQRRLYGLELFDFVNFSIPDLESQPKEVPVTLNLTEGKHRRVQGGIGYGTEEMARVSGRWRTVNFLGGGRSASVEGKWSSLDRGLRGNVGLPYFFSPSYRLDAQLQQWHSNEPAYDLLTRGGRATISRDVVRRDEFGRMRSATRGSLTFVDEYESYTISEEALADPTFRDDLIALGLDPETSEGRGTLVAVALALRHDTVGNLLDARRGYVAAMHLEQAGRVLGGDWQYTETTLEGRHYLTLGRWGVLATMARGGAIVAPGKVSSVLDPLNVQNPNVPFFKRYFLGGSNSLRGWGRYEVSPLNSEGFPIGGLARLEIASEVRVPIRGNFSGVLFAEGGNAWPDVSDMDIKDLFYDAGAGVRYMTPIGPLRFDVGYQLTPIEGLVIDGLPMTRRWRIHFSVGQAF
jgi:outer membrane protein insertion porin family/translocation and assembly module TamA